MYILYTRYIPDKIKGSIFFEIVQYIYTLKREFYYSFKFFCFYKKWKIAEIWMLSIIYVYDSWYNSEYFLLILGLLFHTTLTCKTVSVLV